MLNKKHDIIEQRLLPVIIRLMLVIVVLIIGLMVTSVVLYYGKQKDNAVFAERGYKLQHPMFLRHLIEDFRK